MAKEKVRFRKIKGRIVPIRSKKKKELSYVKTGVGAGALGYGSYKVVSATEKAKKELVLAKSVLAQTFLDKYRMRTSTPKNKKISKQRLKRGREEVMRQIKQEIQFSRRFLDYRRFRNMNIAIGSAFALGGATLLQNRYKKKKK